MRTSQSHPLVIDAFDVASGKVGMTLCPGKHAPSLSGPEWKRDLQADVTQLAIWKTAIVVSLTESDEMEKMNVANMGEALKRAGILWYHLPIPDTQAPDKDWYAAWRRISPALHQSLEDGKRIVIHCKAGLERTALVASLLLTERGESLSDAVRIVTKTRKGAGLMPVQRNYLAQLLDEGNREKQAMRACLFGGAIGDSLGAEIEFWSLDRISGRFPNGIDKLLPHQGKIGAITDDTQMTLFVAEGIVRAMVRGMSKGICHAPSVVHHALLRWLETQGERGQVTNLCGVGLVSDPRLHARRAPGMTCLSGLKASAHFGDKASNQSKGCGTIMRVTPIGLSLRMHLDDLANNTSLYTHGHETGRVAAMAFAHIIADVLEGKSLDDSVRAALQLELDPSTRQAILKAVAMPTDGTPEQVERLGGGWVAEEALAIAIYAARCARGFAHGLTIAVTHSGDSDSTGAIAGNLLGLIYPTEVMAHPWRRQIECADLINRAASDLFAAKYPDLDAERGSWDTKFVTDHAEFYPGW